MFGEVFGDTYEVIGDNACLGLEGGPWDLLAGFGWRVGGGLRVPLRERVALV